MIIVAALVALAAQIQVTVPQQGAIPQLTATPELRVDAAAANLAPVGGIRVGPAGRMLVAQAQDAHYLVFDSTGKRVATVGALGEGPGEFTRLNIQSFGFKGDSMWSYDQTAMSLSWFNGAGTFLSRAPVARRIVRATTDPTTSGVLPMQPRAVFSDGTLLVMGTHASSTPDGQRWCSGACVMVATSEGLLRRTVGVEPPSNATVTHTDADGRVSSGQVPFAHRTITASSASGESVVFIRTNNLLRGAGVMRVTALRATGDTLFDRELHFRGVAVTAARADSAVAARVASLRQLGLPVADVFARTARGMVPPVEQPYQLMRVGLDNTIWISLQPTESMQSHIVLDARGNVAGIVTLPRTVLIHEATRTRVWATEADQDGVQSIVRYRISGG